MLELERVKKEISKMKTGENIFVMVVMNIFYLNKSPAGRIKNVVLEEKLLKSCTPLQK